MVSARIKARSRDGSLTIDGAATFENPRTDGWINYVWTAPDTAVATLFLSEVEVMWPGGRPQTFPNDGFFQIEVEEDRG